MGIFNRAWRLVKGGGLHGDDPEARESWHRSSGVRAEPSEAVVPFSSLRSTGDLGQGSRRMIDSPFSFSGGKMPRPSMKDINPDEYAAVDPPYTDAFHQRMGGAHPQFQEELDPGVLALLQSIIASPVGGYDLHASPAVDDYTPEGDSKSWTPNRDIQYNEHSIPNPNAEALGSEGLKERAGAAKETQPDDRKKTLEENPDRTLPKKDDESTHEGDE